MILEKFEKQPRDVKDYDINYSDWLASASDAISAVISVDVVCQTEPSDTSLLCDGTDLATTFIKLWMSGGTDGYAYKVTVLVSTVGGRVDESELIFIIKDR